MIPVSEASDIDEVGDVENDGEEEEGDEYVADEANATPGRRFEGQDDCDEPLDRQQDRRPNTRRTKNLLQR